MKFLITLFCFIALTNTNAQPSTGRNPDPDAILGKWYVPSRESYVEFFKTGDRYFARVTDVGGSWKENYTQIKGKIIISNLRFTGKEWADGELIHPDSQSRFDVALTLQNANTATATAYKSVRFLHKDFKMIRQSGMDENAVGYGGK